MGDGSRPVVPVSVLGRQASAIVRSLENSSQSVVISRRGEPAAVLLGIETFLELQRDRALLRALALGEIESAAGEGHDLEEVMADAEALLSEN